MVQDNNYPPQEPIPGYDIDAGMEGASAPAVASAPGKLFLILFLGAAFFFAAIYFVFSGGEKKETIVKDTKLQKVAKADFEAPPTPPPVIPDLPPRPIIPEVAEVPLPPPVPVVDEKAPTDQKYLERLRSDMLIFNSSDGVGAAFEDQRQAEDDMAQNDPNLAFAQNAMRASTAQKVKAGHIGDLYSIIAQGKLIHGVLETAINTQLPGVIRAIVSRDIFAEAGTERLVPKGSRMIGVYNTDVFRGQSRVFIVWTRIIRPDGVDIMVNSPGVDKLGRAGLEGAVDGRFRELFSTAILTSVISIGMAVGVENVVDDEGTSTTRSANGDLTTTSTSSSQAAASSIANVGGVARRIIDNVIDIRPVIEIDQGTKVNIMVNKDLIFPSTIMQQTTFVE